MLLTPLFSLMSRLWDEHSADANHGPGRTLNAAEYTEEAQPATPLNNLSEAMVAIQDGGTRVGRSQISPRADSQQAGTTNRNWIPHWSYKKSSIAAACIFTAITVMAFIFLAILSIRKIKRSWERHKRERLNYASSRYSTLCLLEDGHKMESTGSKQSSRESLMFSRNRSPSSTYVVEQEGTSVTRVYRASKNVSTLALDLPSSHLGDGSSTPQLSSIPERPVNALRPSRHERHGSKAKSIVVVPSPLKPVASFSVKPMTHRSEPAESFERTPLRPDSEAGDTPSNNKRESFGANSLFKLPAIQRTMSPLFSF
ncbi:hypothetical protein BO94DRAFT_557864 [Aspergillus sclerotioniger CBS 115572]|uniref:Uncharacterized protein n=1 Tax=Aspergillus sclerotioniger CBS 115572 TaxID=1450535 RepID=A0A317W9B5_9EURO|nr:hypothetical protein BO94DRAFT_557864 [Aspergillus sclerotioniger CBS 115572]PWY83214.1 hypothetical protein BO94DRAFT_557864 [Aspergillus sclerotioniger CBS 115572]